MADDFLRIIPTVPTFVPAAAAQAVALAQLRSAFPGADEVGASVEPTVIFVDAGANVERVACPRCANEFAEAWWLAAMDRAAVGGFVDLAVELPCCGGPVSLADLHYAWPQGFARFVLEVRNPGRALAAEQLAQLGAILGCDLRVIRAHV